MTFRDRIKLEHPEKVNKRYDGGVAGCPYQYNYEGFSMAFANCMLEDKCVECWDREMAKGCEW
jgi:hypothetical protein